MKKKKAPFIVGLAVAAVVIPPLAAPLFVTWSELNCRHQEINIQTGRARFTRYIWFIKVSQRIEDTPLSLALRGEVVDVAEIEPWHLVNTFSPGVHNSPHYRFHSALSQVQRLEAFEEVLDVVGVSRREIASTILTLWQQSGDDRSAENYVIELIEGGLAEFEWRP